MENYIDKSTFTISRNLSGRNKPISEKIVGFSYTPDFSEAQQDIGDGVDLFIVKHYDKLKDFISQEKK